LRAADEAVVNNVHKIKSKWLEKNKRKKTVWTFKSLHSDRGASEPSNTSLTYQKPREYRNLEKYGMSMVFSYFADLLFDFVKFL
jgi:hypothetical protein